MAESAPKRAKRVQIEDRDRPYICRHAGCDKRYPNHAELYTHLRSKHEEPYEFEEPKNQTIDDEKQIPEVDQLYAINVVKATLYQNKHYRDFVSFLCETRRGEKRAQYFIKDDDEATRLDRKIIDLGAEGKLDRLRRAYDLYEEYEQLIDDNASKKDTYEVQRAVSLNKVAYMDQSNDSITHQMIRSQILERFMAHKDAYLMNFYVVAREIVKPFTREFALEVCYIFDEIIRVSQNMKGATMKAIQYDVQIENSVQAYVHQNADVMRLLNAFGATQRRQFCVFLSKILAETFAGRSAVQNNVQQ